MSGENPTGYVMSGPRRKTRDGEYFVVFRPKIAGRRKRVQVPAGVADLLEEAQEQEIAHRHGLVGKQKRKKRKKTAKKRAKRASGKAHKTAAKTHKTESTRAAPAGQQELFTNPRGSRGPNLGKLGTCAHLGQVVKLIVLANDGQHYQVHWKQNRPLLLWSPQQRCLVWVVGSRLTNRTAGAVRADGAARTFERWSQRDAEHTASIKVPNRKLAPLGPAIQIWYWSDKWGEKRTYHHDFSDKVRAYQGGPVWAVRGGALTVTERGIVY